MKYLSLLISLIVLVGCSSRAEEEIEEINNYVESFDKEVSDEEVEKLIEEITYGFYHYNQDAINEYLDIKAMIYLGLFGIGENPLENKLEPLIQGAQVAGDRFFEQVINNFEYYDCVKSYTNKEGFRTIAFRAFGTEGLNYHELMLAKIDGELKIVDIYIAVTGEKMSATMVNMLSQLLGSNEIDLSLVNSSEQITELLASQDYQEAYDAIEALPQNIRDMKFMRVMKLTAASGLDDDLYLKELTFFRNEYPKDPSVELLSFDYFFMKGEYDETYQVLENMQEIYPEDGVIDYCMGLVSYASEECDIAIVNMEDGVEKSPNVDVIWDNLATMNWECGIKSKGFSIANDLIEKGYIDYETFDKYLSINFDDYESWPEYQEWIQKY